MSLVEFAKQELDLIGMIENSPEEMNRCMRDDILDIVQKFADQGHSGFSASYALSVLKKLLAYEPLSPLTGEESEWNDTSAYTDGSRILFQNKRCSHVFKEVNAETGTEYVYDSRGKVFVEPNGSAYTSAQSRTPVTFPYTPTVVYVNVPVHDDTQLELDLQ